MALQVWLPLNGNLNNQGLTNVTVTNNNATINNNGKIGKCYYFYESSAKITNTLPSSVTSAVGTMSCWVKFNSFPSSGAWYCLMQLGTIGGFANCRLGLYMQYQTGIVVCINASSDNNLYTHSLNTNQWYHLCTTFDGIIIRLYINGIEVWHKTASIGSYKGAASTLFIGGTNNFYFKGYMNDVRYYDHALSPKEVEILSRGLVCHYPLNGGGRGGDNIMPNSYSMQLGTSSAANGVWRLAGDSTMNRARVQLPNGAYCFQNSGTQTANDGSCYGIDSFPMDADTDYVLSMYARITSGTEGYAGFVPYSCTITGGSHTKQDKNYYVTPLTDSWQRCWISFHTNSATARNIYIGITTGSTSVTTQMCLVKLEKGTHPTPWMPKSTDTEYTKMGYDSTTEYDVSGYKYNGTKTGTFAYDVDTPRYSVSSVLSGSSTRIPNTTINIGNEWSYGLWFKSAAAARSWEGLVILNNSGGDTDIQLGFYTNPNSSRIQTTANGQYNMISHTYDGKWHHLFATFDGTTLKTYKDGELVNTKTITNNLLSRSNLTIGARRRGEVTFDCPYKGSLSDFRLYATALSAAQVAELYNTAVSIANNGTLMGYELVEV